MILGTKNALTIRGFGNSVQGDDRMLPCIGRTVVAKPDDPIGEEFPVCHICGRPLADLDHNVARIQMLCSICHDRLMEFMFHPIS